MTKINDLCGMTEDEALRFDDDGHGAAIGIWPPDDNNEDDLGVKWGPSEEIPLQTDYGIGVQVDLATERAIADRAIAFINKTVGQSGKYRYALLQFDVTLDGTPNGGATVDHVRLTGTIDDGAIINVAADMVVHKLLGDEVDPFTAPSNMDI
jgi:hypothetical protein